MKKVLIETTLGALAVVYFAAALAILFFNFVEWTQ